MKEEIRMRTITVKKNSGSKFSPGWHNVEIVKAVYGDYEGTKYIDCYFKDYPDSLNLRLYEKKGKDGEEFAIGRLFRFANAGISEVLDGANGESIVKIDDSAASLIGKQINIYFYKDGKYSRVLSSVAPTAFENDVETFNDDDVSYWKQQAENYYEKFVASRNDDSTTDFVNNTTSEENTTQVDEEIPF